MKLQAPLLARFWKAFLPKARWIDQIKSMLTIKDLGIQIHRHSARVFHLSVQLVSMRYGAKKVTKMRWDKTKVKDEWRIPLAPKAYKTE